jgi:hypothetical protein
MATRILQFSGPRERVEFRPRITPRQMRPESWLGALFSRNPRYTGPAADDLNAATALCFRNGVSADEALAAIATGRRPQAAGAITTPRVTTTEYDQLMSAQ